MKQIYSNTFKIKKLNQKQLDEPVKPGHWHLMFKDLMF